MNNSFNGHSQRQREILNLLNSDKLLENKEHSELQREFQNIEKQVSKQRSINLTNLQKVKINNILQDQMSHLQFLIMQTVYEVLDRRLGPEKATPVIKEISQNLTNNDFINEKARFSLEMINRFVHHSNRDISELRGAVRDMKNFAIPDYLKVDEMEKYAGGYDGELAYIQAMNDVLSYTKKMLQGHDRKFYYQNKSCLKCNVPIEDWDEGTVSKKGVICAECTGDPTSQLDI